MDPSQTFLDPNSITKYIGEINLGKRIKPKYRCEYGRKIPIYEITLEQTTVKLHPQIPPTKMWLYNANVRSLIIEARRNDPIKVKWINRLPLIHLLQDYIDHSLDGAQKFITPDVRNSVHLHGGEQESSSDGGPLDWFTPGQFVEYYYPNEQQATMLFWHDHAIAITRLNVYAGLSGGIYLIRDEQIEESLHLPAGEFEVPLVITDKTFAEDGSLIFPHHEPGVPFPDDHWASHFLGLMILVNNSVWPYMNVKRAKYRFRIVNGSDTRSYSLKLYHANDLTKPGPLFVQIGTDGGYLPHPIVLDKYELLLTPAERADVVVDFSNFKSGTEFIMTNSARAPFPNGSVPNDNNGRVMKFIITGFPETSQHAHIRTPDLFKRLNECKVSKIRQLTLDTIGMDMQPEALFLNNSMFSLPVTERPFVGATEIWEFINFTNGAHPIHLHLIQFQLLNRQAYDVQGYNDALNAANPDMMLGEGIAHPVDVTSYLIGEPVIPTSESNEFGWKDVIRADGSVITRIIARFAPQDGGTFPFDATTGPYTWHCHILSHEDNDMMRPYRLFNKI